MIIVDEVDKLEICMALAEKYNVSPKKAMQIVSSQFRELGLMIHEGRDDIFKLNYFGKFYLDLPKEHRKRHFDHLKDK